MFNPIEARKRLTQERIEKSFNDGLSVSEEIEKGRHGIYEDNAENRRKNRVGQEYGHAAQQKELSGKQHGAAKTIDDHASAASDEALKRAAADERAKPEVREAAKKELSKRAETNKEIEKHHSSGVGDKSGNKNDEPLIDKNGNENRNHPKIKRMNELFMKMSYSDDGLTEDEYNEYRGLLQELHEQKTNNKNWMKIHASPEEYAKKFGSSNNSSVSENDVKSFLTQKLGDDDVTDELVSDVMEVVNQHRAAAQKKNETINKIKQNAAESKETKKEKSRRLKQILENGTDKHDSVFMSNNESYFKDVLSKYGFDSWDDFEEWGADGADDDWDKYEKIFKTCFNKIPAEKFLKKSSFDELNSVSDLIEEIRSNR